MADDEVRNDEQAKPASGRKPMVLLMVALVLGGGLGAVVVGPPVAERISGAPSEGGDHGKKKGGGHGGGHGGEGGDHLAIDNLVLNPAETKGTRFLMANVAVSLHGIDPSSLSGRDAEIRDRLMSLLGGKTVDELTDVAQRDSLKAELRYALEELLGEGTVEAVFLPTFVVQ